MKQGVVRQKSQWGKKYFPKKVLNIRMQKKNLHEAFNLFYQPSALWSSLYIS